MEKLTVFSGIIGLVALCMEWIFRIPLSASVPGLIGALMLLLVVAGCAYLQLVFWMKKKKAEQEQIKQQQEEFLNLLSQQLRLEKAIYVKLREQKGENISVSQDMNPAFSTSQDTQKIVQQFEKSMEYYTKLLIRYGQKNEKSLEETLTSNLQKMGKQQEEVLQKLQIALQERALQDDQRESSHHSQVHLQKTSAVVPQEIWDADTDVTALDMLLGKQKKAKPQADISYLEEAPEVPVSASEDVVNEQQEEAPEVPVSASEEAVNEQEEEAPEVPVSASEEVVNEQEEEAPEVLVSASEEAVNEQEEEAPEVPVSASEEAVNEQEEEAPEAPVSASEEAVNEQEEEAPEVPVSASEDAVNEQEKEALEAPVSASEEAVNEQEEAPEAPVSASEDAVNEQEEEAPEVPDQTTGEASDLPADILAMLDQIEDDEETELPSEKLPDGNPQEDEAGDENDLAESQSATVDTSDPNKILSPDDIAALIASMNG